MKQTHSSAVDRYGEARPQVHRMAYPFSIFWPFALGYRHRISELGDYVTMPY